MKRIIFLAAVALLVACQQEDKMSVSPQKMTVTAYSGNAASTKTSLSGNSVLWSSSDHINLFYNTGSAYGGAEFECTSVSEGGKKAVFEGPSTAVGSDYIALYPYSDEAECSKKGKVTTTLPGVQSVVEGSFDSEAAISIARGTDKDNLIFNNIGSLLGVSPKESDITSVTIIGSAPMSGEFEAKADGTVEIGKGSRAVRINGAMNAGSWYYASVLPGNQSKIKLILGRNDGKFASFSGAQMTLASNELRQLFNVSVGSWKESDALYINEVQCGPDNEKRIEIYNPGDKSVDLFGWTIVKDDSALYAFSEGSSIASHGYYVINCKQDTEDATSATFGISGDKGFNLKLCHGCVIDELDNYNPVKVVVDGYTYGRETDGGTPWVLFSNGSIGADNSTGTKYVPGPSTTGIVLNEIDANGGWIELKNTTGAAVSLENFKIYVNEEHKPVWTGDAESSIAANGFHVINAVTGISSSSNLTVVSEDASGNIVGTFTRGSKGSAWGETTLPQNTDFSFSLVGGIWVYAAPTQGAENGAKQGDIEQSSQLILNEINGDPANGQDYIELYNPGISTEILNNFRIRRMRMKNGADDEQTLWKGGNSITLAPGAYLTLYYKGDLDDNKTYPLQLQRDFSAKKNTNIWLEDSEENVLCRFTRGEKNIGWNTINMQKVENPSTGVAYSYSYYSDSEVWGYANPTPNAANGKKLYDIDQTMCPVVMNEINMPGNWIELYNMGNATADISDLQLRWSRVKSGSADNQTVWEGGASQSIAPGCYLKVSPSKVDLSSYTSKNIHIKLRYGSVVDGTEEKIECDDFKRGTEGANWTTVTLGTTIVRSIIRVPDGSGDWYLGNASPEATNGTDTSGGKCPEAN